MCVARALVMMTAWLGYGLAAVFAFAHMHIEYSTSATSDAPKKELAAYPTGAHDRSD